MALAVDLNVFLMVHTDRDFNWGLVAIRGRDRPRMGGPVVCYMCFPSLDIAVALRNGDMLLFNTKLPHCISS